MPLTKRRRRSKDKLTVTETIRLDETADQAAIEEWAALVGPGFGGFAWKLRCAEQIWRPHAPLAGVRPVEHSLGWYANEILWWISVARAAFKARPLEELALAALAIGQLHEEGRWRQVAGDLNQHNRQQLATNRRAARRRGRARREEASKDDPKILTLARQLRRRHPDHSVRSIAREISRRLNRPVETIRNRLRRRRFK